MQFFSGSRGAARGVARKRTDYSCTQEISGGGARSSPRARDNEDEDVKPTPHAHTTSPTRNTICSFHAVAIGTPSRLPAVAYSPLPRTR